MTVAFADPAERMQWIRKHASSKPLRFECHGVLYTCYLVTFDVDEDMSMWLGYCPTTKAFYISDTIDKRLRDRLLLMECTRLFHSGTDKTHLNAVKKVFGDPTLKRGFRAKVIELLYGFYRNYADKFADLPPNELSKEQKDIIATARHFESP